MKSVAAIFLVAWCGCAQADVYKWTDERGEVHFGEHPAGANAEKVMTQEQIQRTEDADQAMRQGLPAPSAPSDGGQSNDQEVRERIEECQRFRSLREDFLANAVNAEQNTSTIAGYSVGYLMRENEVGGDGLMDYAKIEANVRKYCRD